MKRDVLSALAGAAGCGLVVLTLSALQPHAPGAPAVGPTLAPTPPSATLLGPVQAPLVCPKREIVNLSDSTGFLTAGVPAVVYAVPAGKELVVTDFYFSPVNDTTVQLVEDVQGVQTVRINDIAPWDVSDGLPVFHGTTGVLFRPGAEVQLVSTPTAHPSIEYHLFGYLVDA